MSEKIVPLLVNGAEQKSAQSFVFPVLSPFDGSVLYQTQGASPEDITAALEASQAGFQKWRQTNYLERRQILNTAADILQSKKSKFVDLMVEMALPPWFAELNVDTSVGMIRECAALVSQPDGLLPPTASPSQLSLVYHEPIGPVLSIAPWNAPCILATRAIANPLAAGCSVILKSSEHSPLIHYELTKVFQEAGLPEGAIGLVHAPREQAASVTRQLMGSKSVRKVNFTGSTLVGREIAKLGAEFFKPVLLELGGKGSCLVTKSADLEKAAAGIVLGAFGHNGQVCMSTERVFVDDQVYEPFLEAVSKAAAAAQQGAHLPQRSETVAARASHLVQAAIKGGARVVYGSHKCEGTFIDPIILADVDPQNELFDSETFGPVFFVNKFTKVDEAVDAINGSDYGLSTAVWCSDTLEAISLARKIESGAVHVNGCTLHDEPVLPHGGVKQSGSGRFNGVWGLREFQYEKTITIS